MAERGSKGGYDREHRGAVRRFYVSVSLILLVLLAGTLLLGFMLVRDDGMRPSYRSGTPLVYLRHVGSCKRGDAVVLRLPDGSAAVRRVIAVSGDSVELRDGIAYINGLAERGSYSFTRTDPREEGPSYPVILRAGELFVLGDAREDAVDSRSFGVVRASDLIGKPLW